MPFTLVTSTGCTLVGSRYNELNFPSLQKEVKFKQTEQQTSPILCNLVFLLVVLKRIVSSLNVQFVSRSSSVSIMTKLRAR
jgi:hypothetical protein